VAGRALIEGAVAVPYHLQVRNGGRQQLYAVKALTGRTVSRIKVKEVPRREKQLMLAANLAGEVFNHVPRVAAWIVQEGGQVGWDPISLWKQMGIIAKIVVVILFIMSGWSIGVMIDRAMAYSAARKQSRAFAPAVAGALRDGRIDEAIKVAERNKKSHLAKVVTAGLMEFKAHQDSPGAIPGETIEASKRALERTEAIVHAELKRGLGGLATIGSTAPFVGLFGTVMGILNAFKGISEQKATGLGAVAGGISEALVTTAFGLLVAIPAVMMFNYLTGRVEAFDVEMDNSSSELIDYFLKRREVRRS
jgi:biopolymer transport protein ExbB/biopolymer transport protein TolQ